MHTRIRKGVNMRNNSNASAFDLKETQIAIKSLKDYFERELGNSLNLARVSAPLFVRPQTGLNDNLNGVEKAVSFSIRHHHLDCEIVQSLAKWKRWALKRYNFGVYEGLYTDMNAIRPDEELDELHSAYVDQWDWEKIIKKSDRSTDYLKACVREIFEVFKRTETYINSVYPYILSKKLPDEITFVTTQEMEDEMPALSPREREREYARKYKAIFIIGIGGALKSGKPHDLRSPDYDDWSMNGDIIFWDPVRNDSIELSSMGVRVDEDALKKQLAICNAEDRLKLPFHQALMNKELPYTIGGGIGQSRLCMYFLEKHHIGEVQCSVWDEADVQKFAHENLTIL